MKPGYHTFPIDCHRKDTFIVVRSDKDNIPSDLPIDARMAANLYFFGNPNLTASSPIRIKGEAKVSRRLPAGAQPVGTQGIAWIICK